jgi:cell division protein FtsL
MINLTCKKCKKNFNDCKCPDKYQRYNQHKNKKKNNKILIISLIALIVLVLLGSIVLSIETLNTKEETHSKVIYYNPVIQKESPKKPCPCSEQA